MRKWRPTQITIRARDDLAVADIDGEQHADHLRVPAGELDVSSQPKSGPRADMAERLRCAISGRQWRTSRQPTDAGPGWFSHCPAGAAPTIIVEKEKGRLDDRPEVHANLG
jgi:hypothetical protein